MPEPADYDSDENARLLGKEFDSDDESVDLNHYEESVPLIDDAPDIVHVRHWEPFFVVFPLFAGYASLFALQVSAFCGPV